MDTTTKRLFLAIDFSPELKDAVFQQISTLPIHYIDFIPQKNLHLTLHWFGETHTNEIKPLLEKLLPLSEEQSFNISLKGLKLFDNRRKNTVLWIDVDRGQKEINAIKNKLDNLLNINKEQNGKKFSPHVTISRLRQNKPGNRPFKRIIGQNSELPFGKGEVKELVLFESVAAKGGREYLPIKTIALR